MMELDTMTSSLNCTTMALTSDPNSSADALFSDIGNVTNNVTSGGGSRAEDYQYIIIRTICEVWLSIPIAVAGIVGNILSLIVLCHHKQILTTTLVLQALAVADTLVLVFTLFLRSFRYVGIPGYDEMMPYVFPWAFPTMHQIRLVDTWLTVLLTVDRYIAVCHPLHAQHVCTIRRTYVIIIVTVAAVTLFCVPRYFEYERVDQSVSKTGFKATALMANQAYAIGYSIIGFFVVMYLVPMTMLTVLNGWILVALRRSQAMRDKSLGFHQGASTASSAGGSKQNGKSASAAASTRTVTMIAMTIVLICIVCNITAMAAHIMYSLQTAFREKLGFLEHYRRHLANYSNVLITLNSAINFVVYCAFSRKFRNVFVRVFIRRRPHSNRSCFGCCGRSPRNRMDLDGSSESGRRQSSMGDRYSMSQTTKRVSVSSIRSVVKRDVLYNGDREAQMLCESSVL